MNEGWMKGWMEGWVEGWMEGWTDDVEQEKGWSWDGGGLKTG